MTGFRTSRQVGWAGTFDGESTVGLGIRARLPYRVILIVGPSWNGEDRRLVVDVAHRW